MKKLTLIVMVVALVGITAQLDAATCNFRYGDGNWSNAALWQGGVPDATKSAELFEVATLDVDANCSSLDFGKNWPNTAGSLVVSANNTLTVGGNAQLQRGSITQSDGTIAFGGEFNMSTNNYNTTVDVSGGQLTASQLTVGRPSSGVSVATLTQSGGTITTSGNTYIARNTGSNGSKFTFSGGTFDCGGNFQIGADANDLGTFEIVGNAVGSSIDADKLLLKYGKLTVKLDPNGSTPIDCSGYFTLDSGTTLEVDTEPNFTAEVNDTFVVCTGGGTDSSTLLDSSEDYMFSKSVVGDNLILTYLGPTTTTVTITAQDGSADEQSPDTGTLRITRNDTAPSALTVYYSVSGTADANDYTEDLSGSATIDANNTYADVTITPVDDANLEGTETVIMTLEPNDPNNYSVGDPNNAMVTIADNDTSLTYSLDEKTATISYPDVDVTLRRPVVSDWSYAADANTYWVATDGNDSNPGTFALPFKTIQAGVDAAGTGNNVYIKPGTYTDGFEVENKGGTSGDPMIISCEPNASLGSVVVHPDANWYNFNSSTENWDHLPAILLTPGAANGYVYINGLVVMGPKTWAPQAWWDAIAPSGGDGPGPMKIGATGGNCRITNCVLLDAMHCGIKDSDNSAVLFEGNIIFNTGPTRWDHSVYFDHGDGTTVNGNICFKSNGYGLLMAHSPLNLIVTRNISFDCDKSGILCQSNNSEFYHNTSWNNTEYGFTFFGYKPQNSGAIVKNNIFANNGIHEFEWNHDDPNGDPSDPNYVAPVVDYNCYYPVEPDGPGANSVNADPKLVDPNGGDFRIYGLSPCVDAGTDLSAEFAAAGLPYLYYDPNKAGTAPDMGAFEYIPGDNNGDGKCNIDDYITLIGHYNSAGSMADGDTNGDGQVNIDDYIDLVGNCGYEFGAAAAAPAGDSVALGVSVAVAGNIASASITGDTYGNTSYTYVWTATSATNTVYSYGGAIATFDIDEPGEYTVTVTVFGDVGGQATAVYRYLTVE